MIDIIPAIMPKDLEDLQNKMRKVKSIVKCVQIDVMDGIFVPSITWPYSNRDGFEDIVSGEVDMPFLKDLEFEVDMMISSQEREVEKWIYAGARRVIGHIEAMDDPNSFIKTARSSSVPTDSPLSVELGIAIGIESPIDILDPLIPDIDFVQVMGIAKIGYQGEDFDERAVEKVSYLRRNFPELIISVDGGVDEDSGLELVRAGANRLVSGSAIFESEDKAKAVKLLSSLNENK